MLSTKEEKLLEQMKTDVIYQELLNQCLEAETRYQRLLTKLNANDQNDLEHYIALCEELEYRRASLALELNEPLLT